ncbi:PP2C family protein-serine/threonine phosphatase [Methylotuvimicrobium buryatense]|uniref:Serine/threonine-protein phosphatase n=1 Tax=Methylotuvimicrobium buryatense TaxID=95641 RepID=A0A4P9UPY1_METBY|nr:protein phosphatase 2C domain-containing protein [Methylotuvimicrobium buryatense]QCW81636.1 serine/threonine-protein phosphatase [Methylotuvimicrobium buryatense]
MKFDLFKRLVHNQAKKTDKPNVQFSCFSHSGKVRSNNEDSFLMLPEKGIWAVADGMGGHNCGEVASAVGLMTLHRELASGAKLIEAIQRAHLEIKEQAFKDPEAQGMGMTLVAIQIEEGRYQIAWVGDSRAYLWRNNGLRQLTKDHSYVQMLMDQGLIDEESAKTHPYKNVITQAIGSSDKEVVQVDVVEEIRDKRDIVLLCSDGLTGQVPDSTIATILAGDGSLDNKTEQLLAEALANAADDNITLILLAESQADCS